MKEFNDIAFSVWWNSFCQCWDRSNEKTFINSYIEDINSNNRTLLDVGCADLFLFSNDSYLKIPKNYYGIEPNKLLYNFANKILTPKIFCESGENFRINDIKFDYIFLFWILHHSKDNRKIIKNCLNHLSGSGKIVITIPDFDSQLYYEIFDFAKQINKNIDFIEPNIHVENLKNEIHNNFNSSFKLTENKYEGTVNLPKNSFFRLQVLMDFFFWILPPCKNINKIDFYQELVKNQEKFKELPKKLIDKSLLIEISNT